MAKRSALIVRDPRRDGAVRLVRPHIMRLLFNGDLLSHERGTAGNRRLVRTGALAYRAQMMICPPVTTHHRSEVPLTFLPLQAKLRK